jgi:hypothetical protein
MLKLQHPPVINSSGIVSKNPFNEFDPNNSMHYPIGSGVYIYGIKVEIDGEIKFVPICVGESENLKDRLRIDHFIGKFQKNYSNLFSTKQKNISEKKELWDFSKNQLSILDIAKIYCDMRLYILMNSDSNRTTLEYMLRLNQLKSLIYFQNNNYFNAKYGKHHENPHQNISASEACIEFPTSKNKISGTLKNFVDNFYFVYANTIDNNEVNLDVREDRLNIEVKLNQELIDQFNIYTTADKNRKGRDFYVQFDFSLIRQQMVNLK